MTRTTVPGKSKSYLYTCVWYLYKNGQPRVLRLDRLLQCEREKKSHFFSPLRFSCGGESGRYSARVSKTVPVFLSGIVNTVFFFFTTKSPDSVWGGQRLPRSGIRFVAWETRRFLERSSKLTVYLLAIPAYYTATPQTVQNDCNILINSNRSPSSTRPRSCDEPRYVYES